jgi:hypothetical protein
MKFFIKMVKNKFWLKQERDKGQNKTSNLDNTQKGQYTQRNKTRYMMY